MKKRAIVERCFYCGALLSKNDTERDHFPKPERAGGWSTVPACRACHDMKDRFRFDEVFTGEWLELIEFHKLNRWARIFLAKTMAIISEASANDATRASAMPLYDENK